MEQFRERRIIRLEAPGTGLSSTPAFPVRIPAAVRHARGHPRRVRQSNGPTWSASPTAARWRSNSRTTTLARQAARARRDLLRGGVGAGLAGGDDEPGDAAALLLTELLQPHRPDHVGRRDRPRLDRAPLDDPGAPPSPAVLGRLHHAAAGHHGLVQPAISCTQIPHETLVICGDDDPLVPVANGEMLARLIPRAQLEVVERAGHLLLWDDAKNASRRIRRFLNSETTDPTAPRRTSPGRRSAWRSRGSAADLTGFRLQLQA